MKKKNKKQAKQPEVFKLMAGQCQYCDKFGGGPGRDDYGHIHCRLCDDWEEYEDWGRRFRAVPRSRPAIGDTWAVWCGGNRVTVRTLEDRAQPPGWEPLKNMYRMEWRFITIIVGKGDAAQTFHVEEPLLKAASPYFANALKTTFVEGKTGVVELDNQDPEIFGLLNEYLHMGTIRQEQRTVESEDRISSGPIVEMVGGLATEEPQDLAEKIPIEEPDPVEESKSVEEPPSPSPPPAPEEPKMLETYPSTTHFCEVWRLAHYLQITPLMNHAMHSLLVMLDYGAHLSFSTIEDIYTRAPADSALRKFLVHLCVWGSGIDGLTEEADMPYEMLKEMLLEYRRKEKEGAESPLMNGDNYYV